MREEKYNERSFMLKTGSLVGHITNLVWQSQKFYLDFSSTRSQWSTKKQAWKSFKGASLVTSLVNSFGQNSSVVATVANVANNNDVDVDPREPQKRESNDEATHNVALLFFSTFSAFYIHCIYFVVTVFAEARVTYSFIFCSGLPKVATLSQSNDLLNCLPSYLSNIDE